MVLIVDMEMSGHGSHCEHRNDCETKMKNLDGGYLEE